MKLCSKSTLRASHKLIPSYIIEFDELNRSRQVPKLANRLEYPKKQEVHIENLISLKIDAQSFPEADFEIYYRVRHSASI